MLFIKKSLEHHKVENMTRSLNEMECLTVEVCVDGQRVNITCVYRAPSTSMKMFNDIMYDRIVSFQIRSHCCGDILSLIS